jgi:hypothetical protein
VSLSDPRGPAKTRASENCRCPTELLEAATWIMEQLAPRRLAPLRGLSPSQRSFGASCRASLIRSAIDHDDADRELVLRVVADPTYFIAEAKRTRESYESLRWPRLDQLADAVELEGGAP